MKETSVEEVVSIKRVVANLAGKHRTRLLLVSFDLHGEGLEFKYLIKDHYTKIQQATIQYLSTIELKQINENPRIISEIRKVLLKKLNALPEIAGKIKKLDFTEFNIQ